VDSATFCRGLAKYLRAIVLLREFKILCSSRVFFLKFIRNLSYCEYEADLFFSGRIGVESATFCRGLTKYFRASVWLREFKILCSSRTFIFEMYFVGVIVRIDCVISLLKKCIL